MKVDFSEIFQAASLLCAHIIPYIVLFQWKRPRPKWLVSRINIRWGDLPFWVKLLVPVAALLFMANLALSPFVQWNEWRNLIFLLALAAYGTVLIYTLLKYGIPSEGQPAQ
jgi:hypothetical protein